MAILAFRSTMANLGSTSFVSPVIRTATSSASKVATKTKGAVHSSFARESFPWGRTDLSSRAMRHFSTTDSLSTEDLETRRRLARRLVGDINSLARDALMPVFQGVMNKLQEEKKASYLPFTKKEVWDTVSTNRLRVLEDLLIEEVCHRILKSFSQAALNHMLEQYQENGRIHIDTYNFHLKKLFAADGGSILDSVSRKATFMKKDLRLAIASALQKRAPS